MSESVYCANCEELCVPQVTMYYKGVKYSFCSSKCAGDFNKKTNLHLLGKP